jgi:putative ABC transport system permease protein
MFFGAAPAWSAAGHDAAAALRDGGRVAGSSGSRARIALLVSEVALALVLLIASGLLVRTFVGLAAVDAGFDRTRALTFELTLPSTSYSDPDRIVSLYHAVLQRLRETPGIEWAGIGETVPMGGAGESTGLRIPDRPANDPSPPYANYTIVSPGYLRAAGTPLLRGRDFVDADTADTLPVAIVSAAMAERFWPGQDPIGKQVGVPIRPYNMTIVGVAADVKHLSLREAANPEIYVLFTQKPWPSMQTMHVVVRTKGQPAAMTTAVTNAVHRVDPGLPLAAITTLDAIAANAVAAPRLSMVLVTGFGAAALLLACVGLYGAVSYSVSKRTSEIGIRIALGAPRSRVVALVLSESARIATAGVVIGIGLALVLLRAMAGVLYGVEPTDPATFAGLSLLLLSVVLLACYVPARRATRVDPLTAIRTD